MNIIIYIKLLNEFINQNRVNINALKITLITFQIFVSLFSFICLHFFKISLLYVTYLLYSNLSNFSTGFSDIYSHTNCNLSLTQFKKP